MLLAKAKAQVVSSLSKTTPKYLPQVSCNLGVTLASTWFLRVMGFL